jgi:hypothetical protein
MRTADPGGALQRLYAARVCTDAASQTLRMCNFHLELDHELHP